ncbi:MAG: FkbM family methyltransferase [Terriglobales bacterium]
MNDKDFLTALYTTILRRAPDTSGFKHWSSALAAGTPRDRVLTSFLESEEYQRITRQMQADEGPIAFPLLDQVASSILPIRICDVGAMLIPGEPHAYSRLLGSSDCRVVAFEPVEEERQKRSAQEPEVILLGHIIGDGSEAPFYVVNKPQYSSLYPPDFRFMNRFAALGVEADVVATERVQTRRLDDLEEVRGTNFLKVDVQGAALRVIDGAQHLLQKVAVIHVEVDFAPLYEGQCLFADIDRALRTQGFEFITFALQQKYHYRAGSRAEFMAPCRPTRLLWADAVYVKSDRELEQADVDEIMRTAYIVHVNYGMYDFAAHLLGQYDMLMGSDFYAQYRTAMAGEAAAHK